MFFQITKKMWQQMTMHSSGLRLLEHMEPLTGFRSLDKRAARVQDWLENALNHLETLDGFLWL